MNKQTKTTARGLSLLLGLLLVLGLFSGCAGTEGSSASSGAASGSAVSSAASPAADGSSSAADGSSLAADSSSSAAGGSSSEVSASAKTIALQVVHKDGSKKDFTITTEAENLRATLEQEKLVEGEESEFGLFVKTVDGETVNDADQEWWCLTKGGEMWNNGVDTTEISDGDAYEFTFTVGY